MKTNKTMWKKQNERRRRRPIVTSARRAVGKARVSGKLTPVDCEICGASCILNTIHGHHQDYNKKLFVNWLCMQCHGKVTAIINELRMLVGNKCALM